ncbi:MAG TPA: amidohydrolase family protein [Acetobacteraceae bacterium]|nr:amidohydrolase family protein [Acetobacteraceae bacterium]
MLSRRQGLRLAATLGAAAKFGAAAPSRAAGAATAEAPTVKTPVAFEVPQGACDCHVHVFEPARFPYWAGRAYTPPPATATELLAFEHALHMDRVVIVTPSVYGTDNAATLDGMRQLGPQRARGVAVIGEATSPAELDALARAGIRGVRVNLEQAGVFDPEASAKRLDATARQIAGRPWHLQIYSRLSVIAPLKAQLASLPVPVVLDHFAGARAALGPQQPGFDAVLDLVRSGKAYVKLSGAYRASDKAPDYPDVAPLARALISANPDRLVWGSDWPHPDAAAVPGRKPTDIAPALPIDDGRVLNLLAEWAPDPAIRARILVENPARLYGF